MDAAQSPRQRTEQVDLLIQRLCRAHLSPTLQSCLAVVAIGRYGRRDLRPDSEIDLLIVTARPLADDSDREQLANLMREWWKAGLRLNQLVKSVDECCKPDPANPRFTGDLLTSRFLIGNHSVYEYFRSKFETFDLDSNQPAAS